MGELADNRAGGPQNRGMPWKEGKGLKVWVKVEEAILPEFK